VLRNNRTGLEFPLETKVRTAAESVRLESTISVATAAIGRQLPDGTWHVEAELIWDEVYGAARLGACDVRPALVGGRIVARSASASDLELDVGISRTGVVHPEPGDASIVESAAGTVLTFDLPRVYVYGPARVEGRLFLGRLALPAELVARDGTAIVNAFVSGLAGSYPISTQFGSPGPVATGLDLEVSGVGRMCVVRPEETQAVPGARGAAARGLPPDQPSVECSPSDHRRQPLAQRARKRLPAPVVDVIGRWPASRSLYRRLLRR
jgi:hypothetical protein